MSAVLSRIEVDDDTPAARARAEADLALAVKIGRVLDQHYSGHFFKVEVSSEQGVVLIGNPPLMGPMFKQVIHLRRVYSDPGLKCCVTAAGEILERFNCKRAARDPDLWRELKASLSTSPALQTVFDHATGRNRRVIADALR